MKFLIFLLLIFNFIPRLILAEDYKFVFITDSQNIDIGAVSDDITIQYQNLSSDKISTDETFDIDFKSSSETALFLNSSGNDASRIMSKGTSNRTFYYKDITGGNHTLTLSLKGRQSGRVFKLSQNINVGKDLGKEIEVSEKSNEKPKEEILKEESGLDFKIKNIKDKQVLVGSEVYFEAQTYSGKPSSYSRFIWNFGDGFVREGQKTFHTYRFSGKYQVVLKIIDNSAFEIIKFFVTVKEPNISIEPFLDGVKISNQTSSDVLLNGFVLTNGLSYFNFPENTIIASMQEIVFPKEATSIFGDNLQLLNNLGKPVAYYNKNQIQKNNLVADIVQKTENNKSDTLYVKPQKEVLPKEEKIEISEGAPYLEEEVIYKSENKKSLGLKIGDWLRSLLGK